MTTKARSLPKSEMSHVLMILNPAEDKRTKARLDMTDRLWDKEVRAG